MMRTWHCSRFELPLDRPLVMGILNVTPDSFSDGGAHFEPVVALRHARLMLAEGADIVDVGGESTRPGAAEVPVDEELSRVLPVVEQLAGEAAPVSIDTRHAEVAAACAYAGASIINDVSGFRDDAMTEVAAGSDAGLVVMHMLGEPGTMQRAPRYKDVVAEVAEYLQRRAAVLEAAGVARDRIALDPGIGFGKTTEHNLELLRRLNEIAKLGYPVVIGVSRKRFIGDITGVEAPRDRVAGSLAAALVAVANGAHVVRVHDVADTVSALLVARAIEREQSG